MKRTIIGDAAVATGQDAQTTAESLVGPMIPRPPPRILNLELKPSTRLHKALFRH